MPLAVQAKAFSVSALQSGTHCYVTVDRASLHFSAHFKTELFDMPTMNVNTRPGLTLRASDSLVRYRPF